MKITLKCSCDTPLCLRVHFLSTFMYRHHGNLRMRGFGFSSTFISSVALKPPTDVMLCEAGVLYPNTSPTSG